jgi:hypothetical protein
MTSTSPSKLNRRIRRSQKVNAPGQQPRFFVDTGVDTGTGLLSTFGSRYKKVANNPVPVSHALILESIFSKIGYGLEIGL